MQKNTIYKLTEYLKRREKKHIIVDFDETLGLIHASWDIWKKELRARLKRIDEELIAKYENGSTILLLNDFVARYGSRARNIILPYIAYYESNFIEKITLNDEFVYFIKDAYLRYDFYIWSSNTGNTIRKFLKANRLTQLFKKIVSRDKVMLTKPHPEGFSHIFNKDKHKHKDFLLVGDSLFDEMAARTIGIDYFKLKFSV